MVKLYKCKLCRILLEQGDVIFMRTDIPHGAVENLTENINYRVQVFIEAIDWGISEKDGSHAKKVTENSLTSVVWNSKDSKFKEL